VARRCRAPTRRESYADPDAVREINHKGDYFNVPGPHLCEPSRQRTPFLFQAGTSTAGRNFAANHAEAIFLNGQAPELVRPSVDGIRKSAKEAGRDPQSIKIVCSVLVVVAETDEAAHAKYAKLAEYGDREGALALFGGWSGYDLGKYGDDEDFRFIDKAPPAVRSMVNHWASTSPQGQVWNKKSIADHLIMGGNGSKVIGSPTTVADELERWIDEADLDGFNFSYATIPETFEDIIELLLPELRKRGLFWEDYAVPGGTMRENYLGKEGENRLATTHPGAQYFWKAGEKIPEYAKKESEKSDS
jgi:alkanesulfonate monooxygenase SsuD/methylene tetrahydromethanopterin reductase-like flavin-dependent oxidoreductase (luciferase family)